MSDDFPEGKLKPKQTIIWKDQCYAWGWEHIKATDVLNQTNKRFKTNNSALNNLVNILALKKS